MTMRYITSVNAQEPASDFAKFIQFSSFNLAPLGQLISRWIWHLANRTHINYHYSINPKYIDGIKDILSTLIRKTFQVFSL